MGQRSVLDRFWERVDKTESCWLWTGALHKGYGRIQNAGVDHQAHRFSYELHVGPIPDGLVLDHLCRVRHCVNPAHLEPVANGENVRRGEGPFMQNARKETCVRGHDFTPENTKRRQNGARVCRTCQRDLDREYRRKVRAA